MTRLILSSAISLILLTACHHIDEWENNTEGNFEALWTIVDEHYCFFKEKDIDWAEIHDQYRTRIYEGMPRYMFFDVCADMVKELRDGHVNLSSGSNTSQYTNWWSDYPQNYNERIIQQYYLDFNYNRLGSSYYAKLRDNIGYWRYPSFTTTLGDSNIDAILSDLYLCNGLIIDIRDNGGGDLTNCEALVRRFIVERTMVGYTVNKTGPGHNDFTDPMPYYYDPIGDEHLSWRKPVVVLTNRSTFSAANNFVSIMRYLPNVRIVGARTGGGSGMPMSFEMPNGWLVRMSTVSLLDAHGHTTEFGIEPDEGCAVDLDPELALKGIDTMLERAIEIIHTTSF